MNDIENINEFLSLNYNIISLSSLIIGNINIINKFKNNYIIQ